MKHRSGCAVSAAAVLAATVLPWSRTAAAGRNGWETASLALALDEAVDRPLLTALACVWFAVPVAAALALVVSSAPPRRGAPAVRRSLGALVVLAVCAVLVAVTWAGLDVALPGPLLALAAAAALTALPAGSTPQPRFRRSGAAATGVPS